MEVFGWIVVMALALVINLAAIISLRFGGLDLGPAPFKWWLVWVPAVIAMWWLVVAWAPFTITVN